MIRVTLVSDDVQTLEQLIVRHTDSLIRLIGQEVLRLTREDYVTKGQGSRGQDNISWDGLTGAGAESRAAIHPEGIANRKLRRKLTQEEKELMWDRPGLPRGPENERVRRHIMAQWLNEGPAAAEYWGIRNERAALLRDYHSLIAQEGEKPVGFSTGQLYEALTPGNPGNIFDQDLTGVTVGVDLKHAKHFDHQRQIFPAELPDFWRDEIELSVSRHLESQMPVIL